MDSPTLAKAFGTPGDGDCQTAAYTDTAAALTLVNNAVYLLTATTNCHVIFTAGGSAAATTSDCYLVADVPYWFGTDSSLDRLSVIRATTNGTLYATKLSERAG